MNFKAAFTTLLVLSVGLFAIRWSWACGPSFRSVRYQDPHILDVPRAEIGLGHYGILRPGLPWRDLLQVYRSLQGLKPGPGDSSEGSDARDPNALKAWQTARAKVMGDTPGPKVVQEFEGRNYITINQVGDDALLKATETLADLIQHHGHSPEVLAWVQAQDHVFASTPSHPAIPVQPGANAPEWLVQAGTYQLASAHFYAAHWDLAEQGFRAIAKQKHPKRAWGRYLAARCLVRKAQWPGLEPEARLKPALPSTSGEPSLDLVSYRAAQILLEATLNDPACQVAHPAAKAYLELVRYRTEPAALMGTFLADQEQAEPDLGGQAEGKIADGLHFLAQTKGTGLEVPGPSDLAWWLGAMAGDLPWHVDGQTALARWRKHPSTAWLVAALSLAQQAGPELQPLLKAAKQIPHGSALAPTIRWHLLRLELQGLAGGAQALRLEQALQGKDLPPWASNLLRAKRQALATDPVTWLSFSSRKPAATMNGHRDGDEDADRDLELPDAGTPPEAFEEATARAMTEQLPLHRLPDLLKEVRLPLSSVQALALSAWTKAVLLEDWKTARDLSPFLPIGFRKEADLAMAATQAQDLRFQAALCLLAWPGLRPRVDAGLGRQYLDPKAGESPWSVTDLYRDNWWCGPDSAATERRPGTEGPVTVPGLPEADRHQAKHEKERLAKVASAQAWFGQAVLDFATAHPEDERVPQALHRVVLSNRSPKCPDDRARDLGRKAFQKLHQRYPASPWSKKTPHYF